VKQAVNSGKVRFRILTMRRLPFPIWAITEARKRVKSQSLHGGGHMKGRHVLTVENPSEQPDIDGFY
jgi:hypothetical protein